MKPSIPKGSRDFGPEQVAKRTYIFDILRSTFKKFGYQPIETPSMENLSTLLGKYGDEGDKLLFKVLNSGDFMSKVDTFQGSSDLAPKITEKGLRYDLTIPFARFVVMHRNEIQLPFRRYQIQPVWRADRPQRGRYREFYQCDADVVGSYSLVNEAELVQIYDDAFSKLGLNVVIKVNHRKILQGLADWVGNSEAMMDITVAIDKLDKIGAEGVRKELEEKGLDSQGIDKILEFLDLTQSENFSLGTLKELFKDISSGTEGVNDLQTLFDLLEGIPLNNTLEIDLSLARGLSYYTGCIFEVKALDAAMGSIGGGGRYDNLTDGFGLKGTPGVGVSFGAERIYDIMEELNLFPVQSFDKTQIVFLSLEENAFAVSLKLARIVREQGIRTEVYPDVVKIKKGLDYANKAGIKYAVLIGENEISEAKYAVKDLFNGTQSSLTEEDFHTYFTSLN